MEQRVSVITLGVRDLERSRAFYQALGWTTRAAPGDDVVFFQAGGLIVALWDRAMLAQDSEVEDGGGWGGVTLAHNVGSPAAVDAVTEEARSAGATIAREPSETFWGGYSAAIVDPDGHPWEIAHNPHWTLHQDGSVELAGVKRHDVESWIAAYERAWRSPGTERLADLFTEDASYRLSPYEEPALGLAAIEALWEREREGPDEVFALGSEVFAVEGDRAVVTLSVRYGDPVVREFRDVWLLEFDRDRCARFEEWAFWPDKPYTADPRGAV